MYKGIYLPSSTNSFNDSHLELSYLRYSHRQRQKSLILVNIVDLFLKVITFIIASYSMVSYIICVYIQSSGPYDFVKTIFFIYLFFDKYNTLKEQATLAAFKNGSFSKNYIPRYEELTKLIYKFFFPSTII